MNINIYKLQTKHISMHALCGLTWVNALLAGVLLIQQQTWSLQQAYLIGRTPADRVGTVFDAQEMDKSLRRRVAIEDTQLINDTDIDLQMSSSESSSEISSFKPYIAPSSSQLQETVEISFSSSQSSVEILHKAASASASVSSVSSIVVQSAGFPAFGNAVMPVASVPDWGAMKTPAEWNRSFDQMHDDDFVSVPRYDLKRLTIPVSDLKETRNSPDTIQLLTEKLFYSTRFFAAYNVDAPEFTAVHPGIDLKLADGTPIGTLAGGRIHDVRREDGSLGLHVIVEHRAPDGETYYSIYGHLDAVSVSKGDDVKAGEMIGVVGMTGNTSGPHLHLQVDRGEPNEEYHRVYWPSGIPTKSEATEHTINPVDFVRIY